MRIGALPNEIIVVWSLALAACPGCDEVKSPIRTMPVEEVTGGEEVVQPRADMYHECGHWWGPIVFKTIELPPDMTDLTPLAGVVQEVGAEYDRRLTSRLDT